MGFVLMKLSQKWRDFKYERERGRGRDDERGCKGSTANPASVAVIAVAVVALAFAFFLNPNRIACWFD